MATFKVHCGVEVWDRTAKVWHPLSSSRWATPWTVRAVSRRHAITKALGMLERGELPGSRWALELERLDADRWEVTRTATLGEL